MAPPCVARRGLNNFRALDHFRPNPMRQLWQALRRGLYNEQRFHCSPFSRAVGSRWSGESRNRQRAEALSPSASARRACPQRPGARSVANCRPGWYRDGNL